MNVMDQGPEGERRSRGGEERAKNERTNGATGLENRAGGEAGAASASSRLGLHCALAACIAKHLGSYVVHQKYFHEIE